MTEATSAPLDVREPRLRVLNIITRMILGGAQETVLLSCDRLDRERFACEILTGTEIGSEGELVGECRKRGIPVHLEPLLVRDLHPWKDARALIRLVRFIRRGGYDIVHVHTSKAGILGRLAAWIARAPIVIHTAHGWAFHREQPAATYWLYRVLEATSARLCDAIIVVGEPDREVGLRLGVGRPEQYRLIRSGIEIEAFRDLRVDPGVVRARLGIPADAFVVGTVGRLTAQKAPLDLVDAFARLQTELPGAHLVLVGDGPLRGAVEAEVTRHGLDSRVHVLGLRHDVPELLRAFDAFALSSRWEGLPRVLPQAMAAGLPIVATQVAGASDAVIEGESGWLVPIGDPAALANRLLALARSPEHARRMGERGRSRLQEFSVETMIERLTALYEDLVAERLPAQRRLVTEHAGSDTGVGTLTGW